MALGRLLGVDGHLELAVGALEKAVALNENFSFAHYNLGQMKLGVGDTQQAEKHFRKAITLSPTDPVLWAFYIGLTHCLVENDAVDEAIEAAKTAVREGPQVFWTHLFLTVSYVAAGQREQAAATARELLRVDPKFSTSNLPRLAPHFDTKRLSRVSQGAAGGWCARVAGQIAG